MIRTLFVYSSANEKLWEQLRKNLVTMKVDDRDVLLRNVKISTTSKKHRDLFSEMTVADIVIFLVSEELLDTNIFYEKEFYTISKRAEYGQLKIYSAILSPCDWKSSPLPGKTKLLAEKILPLSGVIHTKQDIQLLAKEIIELFKPSHDPGYGIANKYILPHCNPNFTGREDILRAIHTALNSSGKAAITQAITGLGGIGKTQTALEYAHRYKNDYRYIWWIDAETPASLSAGFRQIANKIFSPLAKGSGDEGAEGVSDEIIRTSVLDWLNTNDGWLLIFDNAEHPKDILDYLPTDPSGNILITSRYEDWSGVTGEGSFKIPVMPMDEAVTFLLHRTRLDDKSGAEKLAKRLGYFPLAMAQAGAFIARRKIGFAEYLNDYDTKQCEIFDRAELDQYKSTVCTTWRVTLDKIGEKELAAVDLLRLLAYFAPDKIPLEIVAEQAAKAPEPLKSAVADKLRYGDILEKLTSYSLIEKNGNDASVHRLVQEITRERFMTADERKLWCAAAVMVLNGAFPYEIPNPTNWPLCARLLDHGLSAGAHAEVEQSGLENAGRLLNQAALYMNIHARYGEAKSAYERAIRIVEQVYGKDHPNVAIRVNNLGGVLRDRGDLMGAKECFERALGIDEKVYGKDHPEVAIRVNNLGGVLRDRGDLMGAKECFERALGIDEKVYGKDHPEVAIRVNNLGGVLYALGDLAGAKQCYERALGIWEKVLGKEHPNVATLVNNLGGVLQDLGDLAGAKHCYERALGIDEKVYGKDHPNVAKDSINISDILIRLGDFGAAKENYRRAYEILERTLGENHPLTIKARKSLDYLNSNTSSD